MKKVLPNSIKLTEKKIFGGKRFHGVNNFLIQILIIIIINKSN